MDVDKVFILLPDGVGLRNFAYTKFNELSKSHNMDLVYWNATPFPIKELGFNEQPLSDIKLHPLTDIYKTARKHIELNAYKKKFQDSVYDTYKFPFSNNSLKKRLKTLLIKTLIFTKSSAKGLKSVRTKINSNERATPYYRECIKTLKKEQPNAVFCTNQRPSIAITPLLAAQDLGIPTITFIFSWDNLPKATMVVETDYYFVWSDYMKQELLTYYPYIKENQILITGTPQFEVKQEPSHSLNEKEAFFKAYNLDLNKTYICYSGDDITTSPDDQEYLNDVALAVKNLNQKGHNLGIIFRRCPVDFSDRYNQVLLKYKEIITPIAPKWERLSSSWNTILPTKDDMQLLRQTINFTEGVVNLGSSMVFDYVVYNKPCAFINYDVKNKAIKSWSVKKIYNYVHFRSMPKNESVIWLDHPNKIENKLIELLNRKNVNATKEWFEVINLHPIENASANIIKEIKNIIN